MFGLVILHILFTSNFDGNVIPSFFSKYGLGFSKILKY